MDDEGKSEMGPKESGLIFLGLRSESVSGGFSRGRDRAKNL